MKIFLGGTCNKSTWRDELISQLELRGIDYFNPIIDDWNDTAIAKEKIEKDLCDIHLYTITPKIQGMYSIAEIIESVIKDNSKITIFNVIPVDEDKKFSDSQIHSLIQIGKMVMSYEGIFVSGLENTLLTIEKIKKEEENKMNSIIKKETWKDRLKTEYDELKIKIDKLNNFGKTDKFKKLLYEKQRLLINQQGHMQNYLNILKERMKE